MNTALSRRLAVAEVKANIVKPPQIVVTRQPFGLDAAEMAAWQQLQPEIAPGTKVIYLTFVPWPPRSVVDVQACIRRGLVATAADMVGKIQCLPDYAEKADVLAGLAL